jgi:hypothetical protein
MVEPRVPVAPEPPKEERRPAAVPKETTPAHVEPSPQPRTQAPLSKEDSFKIFQKTFPDYGEDEFQLAYDDLYPDWKKNIEPAGTWEEFLDVYRDFIKWWTDSGTPQESGMKLWKDYLAARGRTR